jgi:hypothetical protein
MNYKDLFNETSITADSLILSNLTGNQALVTDASSNVTTYPYASTATASTLAARDANGDIAFRDISARVLNLSALTARACILTDASKNLVSQVLTDGQLIIGSTGLAPVAALITGTTNRVSVTSGAGSITLSGPQDIHTGASPQFVTLNLSGLSPSLPLQTDVSRNIISQAI